MKNTDIKIKLLENDMRQWQLARLLGISESKLSRKLRDEISEEEKKKNYELIETAGGTRDGQR